MPQLKSLYRAVAFNWMNWRGLTTLCNAANLTLVHNLSDDI